MTTGQGSNWYLVQTQVNAEAQALRNLLRQGFDVYCPRYLKKRRHARRVETVARPLFPRYIFVGVDLATQRWRSIRSTLGVSHLVTSGERPLAVPNAVIDDLHQREDTDGFVRLERRMPFSPGDKVRVIAGAFVDSLALFEGLGDRDRVSVLLEFLGRKVRVLVQADLIAPA